MGEEIFVKLRYCFAGGYTLPQYCIDNAIKKPLFVLEKSSEWFLREIYAQFRYDGRLLERYCFIDGDEKIIKIDLLPCWCWGLFWNKIIVKNISATNFEDFDKIILLTKQKININDKKVINFAKVERFCMQQTHVDIPLLSFLQRYPKVKLILTNFPYPGLYKDGKEFFSNLWSAEKLVKALKAGEKVKSLFDKFGYTSEQIVKLMEIEKVKKNSNGVTKMADDNHPLLRIQNGKRSTAYQPETYQNKIYFFGSCHHYGTNAPFDKTIQSYMQKMINEHNLPYRVENEAQHFGGRYQDIFYNLNEITPEPGDIFFFWIANLRSNNKSIPFCNVLDAFDPPNDYKEIFCRQSHINELGYKILAEKYFEFLTKNNFFRDVEFKYPPPVNLFTATVYRRNSRGAARQVYKIQNWKLTKKYFAKNGHQLAHSS